MIAFAGIGKIVLAERLADIDALAAMKVWPCRRDHQRIDLADEVLEQVDLARHLCAARLPPRPRGFAETLFQRFELGLHGAAGIGRQNMREPFVEACARWAAEKHR